MLNWVAKNKQVTSEEEEEDEICPTRCEDLLWCLQYIRKCGGTNELLNGIKSRAQGQSHTCMETRYMKDMACRITGERRNYSVNASGKKLLYEKDESRTLYYHI